MHLWCTFSLIKVPLEAGKADAQELADSFGKRFGRL